MNRTRHTSARESERGHLMAGVMVLIAIMLIMSTIAFQSWDQVARRENEAEMIFRAQEIVRALVRYRTDRGTLPNQLEQLIEPGQRGQYYIRRLYTDPLMRDGKWGLLYLGPGGEIIDPNASNFQLDPDGDGTGLSFGDPNRVGGLSAPEPAVNPPTDKRGRWEALQERRSNKGRRISPLRASADAFAVESEMAGGTMLAGLTIAGVRTLSDDKPFRVYLEEEEYENWLFTVLDIDKPKLPGSDRNPAAGNQRTGPGAGFSGFDRKGSSRGRGRFDRGKSRSGSRSRR